MFKNVPRKGSSDQRSPITPATPASEGPDDDTISLTSTVTDDHDPDEEFEVKDILLERIFPEEGPEPKYLVEWEGYPLHRCTWEPASNIGEELMDMWTKKKEQQRRDNEPAWTWETWVDIIQKSVEDHEARHRRRNARRLKLGLPLTEPLDEELGSSLDYGSSSDEAEENRSLASLAAETKAQRRPQPQSNATASTSKTARSESGLNKHSKPLADSRARPAVVRKVSKDSGPSSRPERPERPERPSPTGYQGTARKPSLAGLNTTAGTRTVVPGPAKSAFARKFTAKKSAPVPGATNIFAGGKVRKPRTNLKDVMHDPNKDPKLFTKHRYRRLAEKNSRDKEDRPPAILPSSLFDITKGPPSRKNSAAEPASATSEAHSEPRRKASVTEPVSATSSTHAQLPSPIGGALAQPKKAKKKKSVRFNQEDTLFVDEPSPMDLDSPVQSEAQEQPYPKPRPDGPSRSVERKIKFGSAKDSEPVNAILDGIPSTSDDPWLCGFLDTEVLQMDYTCFAKDFASQKQQVYQYLLCSGTVSSTSSGSVLDNVAVHLRDGILGLYYSTKSFNLILYPSSSDEWRSILSEQGVSSTYGSGSALRYIIFRSPVDFGPFLRRPGKEKLERNPASFDDQLLSRLFKFNYKALLPPKTGMDTNPPYHCFLLFPRTRGDQVAMIARWIRSCNSRCQIFTSYDSGAWSSFCDAVGKGAGIVIVHELLALSLHRIPDLWQRLHNFFEGYWCFSEAIQPQPVFPSLTLPDDVVPMGDMQFTELFPTWPRRRIVVLLTPSFLTSEPLRVFQLLEWFYTFIACRSSQKCKLLTAYTLHEYLGDLALQKSRERDEILEKSRHSISQAEITANIKGLSRDDCENRFKAWSLALELHQMRAGAAGPDDVDEDICSIIYADPSIDANDEQSLVNWFGWWTSMRLDQFRGFHVIGSSSSMKFNGSKKGERFIRIPKYSEGTVNVPDLVREEVERQNNPVAPPAAPSETTIIPSRPAVHRNNSSAGPGGSSQPWVFQSRFVTAESERGFTDAMGKAFYSAGQGKGYLTTFKYPISWTDSHMSFYFSDVQEKFRTVKNWWSFPHAFWYNNRFSTYMGFFYTIAEDWDPENPPADRRPKRHPWICVYRPSSPYVRRGGSAGPCQLIIWDPAAKHKFAGSTTTGEEELTWVQRHVVQLVRDQTPMKNTGSWLDQVWLGGFKHPEADSPYLIDIALQYFKNLQKSLYSELPADEAHLRMLKFRKLRLKAPPPAQNDGQSSTMSEPMDLDTPGGSSAGDPAEKIDNTVMIFHPPRGKPLPSGRTTQCINHLYEAASAAMDEGRAIGGRMRYEFPVTSEWYEAQRFEGRGYEHVNVAPWESVFNLLKIQSSVPQQGAPTARTPQRTSSSAASVERTVNG